MPALYMNFLLLLASFFTTGSMSEKSAPVPDAGNLHEIYSTLDLAAKGLARDVFDLAMKGHNRLEQEGMLKKTGILTIVDFSQSSKSKRLYIIDLAKKMLLINTYVAHGRNTGEEFAKYFSNAAGSYKSSLGFYITGKQITGASVGLSLLLDGIEQGFNDNAKNREIIIHGADYATENFIRRTGRLGRSFGCPSVPPDMVKPVVETIKEGSCLFIYQKDDGYLAHSELLK